MRQQAAGLASTVATIVQDDDVSEEEGSTAAAEGSALLPNGSNAGDGSSDGAAARLAKENEELKARLRSVESVRMGGGCFVQVGCNAAKAC